MTLAWLKQLNQYFCIQIYQQQHEYFWSPLQMRHFADRGSRAAVFLQKLSWRCCLGLTPPHGLPAPGLLLHPSQPPSAGSSSLWPHMSDPLTAASMCQKRSVLLSLRFVGPNRQTWARVSRIMSVLTAASERVWFLRLISFPGAADAVERRVSRCLGCSEKACIPPGTDWLARARMLWPVWLIDRGKKRGSAEKFAMMKRDSGRGIGCRGRKKFHWKAHALPFFFLPAWPWSSRSALHVRTWQVPSAAPLWCADL